MRFDLHQGQLVEECYPPGCLTHDEELQIGHSSFPDQTETARASMIVFSSSDFIGPQNLILAMLIVPLLLDTCMANVFNRHRHAEELKRGVEQKSVVTLSRSPYSSVLKPLLQIVGPLYFDTGKKALEHIASYVSTWSAPVLGKLMDLPIGNATLEVSLPPAHCLPQGLFHDSDVFGAFKGLLLQLWLLWELSLIGEPILIIAPTPPQRCEAVASLVSLVAPLLCSVNFRPYFTIHDPLFSHLNSLKEGETSPSVILGVTNIFFLKALPNFPHVVSVGSPPKSNRFSLSTRSSSTGRLSGRPEEHKDVLWGTYSAITKPDNSILNRFVDAGMSPRAGKSTSVVNNEILRMHFLELTTNFLAPFSPYFRSTTPLEGSSPYVDPPSLPQSDAHKLLADLSARSPGKFLLKRMASNWLDLYRRFLKGPNLMPWFQKRRAVAEQEQHRLWREAEMKSDIQGLVPKMSELEIVDSIDAIERHLHREVQLQQSGRDCFSSRAFCQKLRADLQAVFNALSKDK